MNTQILYTLLVAFAIAIACGFLIIPLLARLKAGQRIREDGPQSHLKKAGTPTMGGIIMMISVAVTTLIFADQSVEYGILAISGACAFGLIGLIDDLIIVLKKRSEGLKPWQKIGLLVVFSGLIAVYCYQNPAIGSQVYIPFFNVFVDLGIFYIPFVMFVMIALTNCVNLTDGLDGLAASVTLVNSATFTIIFTSMTAAGAVYAVYAADMAVFSTSLVGACLGFLFFNWNPARVFMGDTGSFFLGGALSMMAIISRLEFLILFMGFMFVLSGISCIIQVLVYKKTKKRVFRMAPLHHHFELGGMKEKKIVVMYSSITLLMCALTLWMLS